MRASVRTWRWGISLALTGVVAILISSLLSSERLLLRRAAHITEHHRFDEYCWLPGNRVLLMQSSSDYPYTLSVEQLDLTTGCSTFCPRLAKLIDHDGAGARDFQTSPDGKWLLCTRGIYQHWSVTPASNQGFLYATDGSQTVTFPVSCMPSIDTCMANKVSWLPDSQHFVEIAWTRMFWRYALAKHEVYGIIRDVSQPKQVRKVLLSLTSGLSPYVEMRVLSEDHLFAMTDPVWGSSSMGVIQTALVAGGKPSRRSPLPLPAGSQTQDVAFSVQGDRLALVLRYQWQPALARFLARWLPGWRMKTRDLVGIWVCRSDGTQMYEVGHLEAQNAPDQPDCIYLPYSLQWSSDGKHLSFIYKDTLYTIPAD